MIAVDGDSVAMIVDTGTPADHKWPVMLAKNRGVDVQSFARQRATARECAARAWRVVARRPKWYVLAIGQWSQNHEPIADFERYVRVAIERHLLSGIKVCLVTPPTEVTDLTPYLDVLHKCATLYRVDIVDVFEHVQREGSPDWFEADSTVRCHFNHAGALNVLKCFTQPDTAHICLP